MTALLASALAAVATIAALAPWARRPRRLLGSRRPRPARRSEPGVAVLVTGPVVAIVVAVIVVAGVAAGTVPLTLMLGAGAVALAGRAHLVDRRRRRARRAVDRAGPDLVDLLAVAAAAGHPPHRCLHVVADRAPPAVQPGVRASCRRLERGVPLAVAVDGLRVQMGVLGDPVADALLDAFRTGAPLQPALLRVAAVARDRRRRDAEAEARRLPVLLLFPLVCCVLPAFGLLAVVPLIAASLGSLG